MVHQVARQLPQFEAYFTPYYGDGFVKLVWRAGVVITNPPVSGDQRNAEG